jgi:hypothetical protein
MGLGAERMPDQLAAAALFHAEIHRSAIFSSSSPGGHAIKEWLTY